jgi:glycosyltransferase involved in cell wall biosynthesis
VYRAKRHRGAKVRLTYVHQLFVTPQAIGGTRPYEQARRLANEPWCSVRVVCASSGLLDEEGLAIRRGQKWRGMHFDPIHVRYDNRMSMPRRILAFAKFAALASPRILRARTDMYYVSSPPLSATLPVAIHAMSMRRPYILEIRDLWPKAPIELGVLTNPLLIRAALWYERQLYKHAAAIVTTAPSMRKHVEEISGRRDVRVVPNASDLEMRDGVPSRSEVWRELVRSNGLQPGSITPESRILTYVGTLSRVQGVEWLPHLAKALWEVDRSVKLVVVGEGSLRDRLVEELKYCGLLGRNTFILDPVAKNRVGALLNASDLAIALAAPDGALADSANKFYDYAAAGIPIVSTADGLQQSLLSDFAAGRTISRQAADAATQISVLLKDPAQLRAMSDGSKRLGDSYSRDRAYTTLRSTVREVALTIEIETVG